MRRVARLNRLSAVDGMKSAGVARRDRCADDPSSFGTTITGPGVRGKIDQAKPTSHRDACRV